jgi:hypothetical protein
VSWQIEFGLHVSLNIATILAVLKLVVTPTYRHFLRFKDSCDILAYLQFWQNTDYLNKSQVR